MNKQPMAYLTRRESFCASHRLHSEHLSDHENKQLFDKCNHPHGHGHNYVVEVTVKGPIDPITGLVMNLSHLKKVIHDCILAKVDHRHLNLDVTEFKSLNPTAENIALVFWQWLEKQLPELYEVKIYETDKNMARIVKG